MSDCRRKYLWFILIAVLSPGVTAVVFEGVGVINDETGECLVE